MKTNDVISITFKIIRVILIFIFSALVLSGFKKVLTDDENENKSYDKQEKVDDTTGVGNDENLTW